VAVYIEGKVAALRSNTEFNTKIAKLPNFNRDESKVAGFVIACKLYIKMRMREILVKEQVQYVLTYMQRESVNIWKENKLEDLESGELEFPIIGNFLIELEIIWQ